MTRVELGELPADVLIGGHLDLPKAGVQTDEAGVDLVGWVAGVTDSVAEIVLTCDERFWRGVPIGDERPDLRAAFPKAPHAGRAGFHTRVGLRGMTRLDLGVHAKLRDGNYIHLATLGLERTPTRERRSIAAVGRVDLGDLRHVEPVSRSWGFDRGLPIDRHYVESFLDRFKADIRGHALEIGDDAYSRRFGGDRITDADILDIDPNNVVATFVADLTDAQAVPSDRFDVAVVTQVLHLIYDIRAAVRTLHRVLAPGGTLLATFPGISPLEQGRSISEWHWALTCSSARRLLQEFFADDEVQVQSFGNVLAASAFVHGLAVEDLPLEDIDAVDGAYPVIIAVRAKKAVIRPTKRTRAQSG